MQARTIDSDDKIGPKVPTGLGSNQVSGDAVDISVLTSFDVEHFDGQPDLVVELIDLYFDDTPKKLDAMRHAVEAGETQSLLDAAHNLKGSSSTLGAIHMAAICSEIEEVANGNSARVTNNLLNDAEAQFDVVFRIFDSERRKRLSAPST